MFECAVQQSVQYVQCGGWLVPGAGYRYVVHTVLPSCLIKTSTVGRTFIDWW